MTARFTTTPFWGAICLAGLPLLAPTAAIAQTDLWVDPVGGSDRFGNGRPALPVKTISRALELARPNTVVRLEAGTYSTEENFPLVLPPAVSLQGSPRDRQGPVTIRGGGILDAASVGANFGVNTAEHVAIVATGNGSIRGLTISNPQGIGVWVLGNSAIAIENNTFLDSQKAGLAIASGGAPVVRNNAFSGHSDRALVLGSSTGAEVVANTFERNGTGIWIGDVAVPTLQGNRLQGNRIGIAIDGITRPVLRGNHIANSLETGLAVNSRTRPDLGSAASPGNNTIGNSADADVRGLDATAVAAAGNRLGPTGSASNTAIGPLEPPATVAAAQPRVPIAVEAPVARRDRLPATVEKFRSPAPTTRSDGAIAIPVPPPETSEPITVVPPPPPQQQILVRRSQTPTTISAPSGSARVRVLVETPSFVERERVTALVPEAFASSYQGRSVMQVGVFNSQENVTEIRQQLERFGFNVLVVPR